MPGRFGKHAAVRSGLPHVRPHPAARSAQGCPVSAPGRAVSTAIDPRLQRLLGGEALAALRKRLRRHFERADPLAAPAELRIGDLSPQEHLALAALTGRAPRTANSMRIDLAALDAALRDAGIAASLRDALERLDGPIVQGAALRAAAQMRWQAVAAGCSHDALARWLQTAAGLGLLKRLAAQDADAALRLRDRAQAVLQRLPAGGVPRSELAALALGDAHALDAGQPTATLVLAALRQAEAAPAPQASSGELPSQAAGDLPEERARDSWARAGVLVNELARPALLLNLPMQRDAAAFAAPGEPAYASLRRLLRAPPDWAVAGREVFVCENPNVLAIAADRLGSRCAPLVCTDGMPAAAQRCLLTQLSRAGARLRYHGDFDWPGLHIANHVMRAYAARPWRLGAPDYQSAVADTAHADHRLAGTPVAAAWDAALAPTMQAHGLAIAEEALAAALLQDLSR